MCFSLTPLWLIHFKKVLCSLATMTVRGDRFDVISGSGLTTWWKQTAATAWHWCGSCRVCKVSFQFSWISLILCVRVGWGNWEHTDGFRHITENKTLADVHISTHVSTSKSNSLSEVCSHVVLLLSISTHQNLQFQWSEVGQPFFLSH